MKSNLVLMILASILIASLLPCGFVFAWHNPPSNRILDPIVSTEWLNDNRANVIIIDIRDPGAYGAGHIPGSINEPFVTGFDPVTGPSSNWIVGSEDGLWLEVPDDDDLINTIGSLGITPNSWVSWQTRLHTGN